MNDREKIKSIREILSVHIGSFDSTEEVAIIRKILDGKMTQPVWTLTDKEKIKKTLELIEDFENSGSSKHYKANAQKMRIMLDAIKKTLEK